MELTNHAKKNPTTLFFYRFFVLFFSGEATCSSQVASCGGSPLETARANIYSLDAHSSTKMRPRLKLRQPQTDCASTTAATWKYCFRNKYKHTSLVAANRKQTTVSGVALNFCLRDCLPCPPFSCLHFLPLSFTSLQTLTSPAAP